MIRQSAPAVMRQAEAGGWSEAERQALMPCYDDAVKDWTEDDTEVRIRATFAAVAKWAASRSRLPGITSVTELAVDGATYLESTVTKEEILAKVAAGEIPVEEASKLLAKAEQAKRGSLYCKVSEKGAISVYGLQRMPVTLYVEQWERLLNFADQIRQFMKEHDAKLKRKGT